MGKEGIQSTYQKNLKHTSTVKTLELTRKDLLPQYANLKSEEIKIQHFKKSIYPDWYYSDAVFFCEQFSTVVLKSHAGGCGSTIPTEAISDFINLMFTK